MNFNVSFRDDINTNRNVVYLYFIWMQTVFFCFSLNRLKLYGLQSIEQILYLVWVSVSVIIFLVLNKLWPNLFRGGARNWIETSGVVRGWELEENSRWQQWYKLWSTAKRSFGALWKNGAVSRIWNRVVTCYGNGVSNVSSMKILKSLSGVNLWLGRKAEVPKSRKS